MTTHWTIEKIQKMIDDGIEEDLHLDYKSIDSLDRQEIREISKDVSAFANSDGGIIIYGVIEKNNKPVKFDDKAAKVDREWIENIINSNIFNKIEGLRIYPLSLESGNQVFVVDIPKSLRAPHMAKDNRYYKRNEFSSVAMAHYEVEDVRNRKDKAKITSKLIVSPSLSSSLSSRDQIGLYATSSTNTVTDTYSIRFIAEEGSELDSKFFKLVNTNFFSQRHGKKLFGKLYQRIVSPSFGHPIWQGYEVNLFENEDRVIINYNDAQSNELLLVSEIYIPGEPTPTISKVKIINNDGAIEYKFSHEEFF